MSKKPERSESFQAACQLLDQVPLPADAKQQLESLEAKVLPSELELFGDLWETYKLLESPAS